MADDRTFQYCTGLSSYGNDPSSEEKCSSSGSQCSGRNLLLSWCNRTGNLWCKLEIWISVYLRNDRICHFGCCLRYDFHNSQCSRCRRNSGNPFHSAEIYGKFCNLYGDRHCDPDGTDCCCRKEETFRSRSDRSRRLRRYIGRNRECQNIRDTE